MLCIFVSCLFRTCCCLLLLTILPATMDTFAAGLATYTGKKQTHGFPTDRQHSCVSPGVTCLLFCYYILYHTTWATRTLCLKDPSFLLHFKFSTTCICLVSGVLLDATTLPAWLFRNTWCCWDGTILNFQDERCADAPPALGFATAARNRNVCFLEDATTVLRAGFLLPALPPLLQPGQTPAKYALAAALPYHHALLPHHLHCLPAFPATDHHADHFRVLRSSPMLFTPPLHRRVRALLTMYSPFALHYMLFCALLYTCLNVPYTLLFCAACATCCLPFCCSVFICLCAFFACAAIPASCYQRALLAAFFTILYHAPLEVPGSVASHSYVPFSSCCSAFFLLVLLPSLYHVLSSAGCLALIRNAPGAVCGYANDAVPSRCLLRAACIAFAPLHFCRL